MKTRSAAQRRNALFIWISLSLVMLFTGSWLENFIVNRGAAIANKAFGSSIFLFFTAVNLNVLLLLLFVFLTFRSGVKLIVDNSQGVFGSRLNAKLVASFLFFSLLPTVVLLYVSTKFVNSSFSKWLPKEIHNTHALLIENNFNNEILHLSYYVMLGVITLLIVFSATWLGFTIAKGFTVPLQILAEAAESVAHGNYAVKIDDIVSDDEIGKLALSFRSMVADLKTEKARVDLFSQELRKNAEELSLKSEYNEVLLKNVNAAVVAFDSSLFVELWNERAEMLFSSSEEDVLGKHIAEVFKRGDFLNAIHSKLQEVTELGKKRIEFEWYGNIGNSSFRKEELPLGRLLQIAISIVVSPRGKTGKILFINDITELAKEQRLAAWREMAKRIAHEIKNPLTPIKLGAQRLERKFSDEFSGTNKDIFTESLQIILQSTESIRLLVDEFVKYARMPHSLLQEGNIVETIYMVFRSFAGNAENVPIRLEVSINNEFISIENDDRFVKLPDLKCLFDRDQIMRLFVNLINNAITASVQTKEPIVVSLCTFENSLEVQVQDKGTGLSDAVKAKIFEPYFSTGRTGMGLGLAIVKQIINEHSGQIHVERNSPQGTIFIVRLPVI